MLLFNGFSKKVLRLLIFGYLMIAVQEAKSCQNEFRGYEFGQSIRQLDEFNFSPEDDGFEYSSRENDMMILGKLKLTSIYYQSYKGRFSSVRIGLVKNQSRNFIIKTLASVYGEIVDAGNERVLIGPCEGVVALYDGKMEIQIFNQEFMMSIIEEKQQQPNGF